MSLTDTAFNKKKILQLLLFFKMHKIPRFMGQSLKPIQVTVTDAKVMAAIMSLGAAVIAYGDLFNNKLDLHWLNKDKLDPNTFKPFTIEKVEQVNHNSCIIRVRSKPVHGLNGPSHVIIKDGRKCMHYSYGSDTCQIARPYTPIKYGQSYIDLLIKGYPDGSVSKYLQTKQVGQTIEMRG